MKKASRLADFHRGFLFVANLPFLNGFCWKTILELELEVKKKKKKCERELIPIQRDSFSTDNFSYFLRDNSK